MRSHRAIVTILFLLALGVSTGATENAAGLFAIGSSGRALGLGGAFTALADDESAVSHNPAGLSRYEGLGVSSLFVRQFGGASYGALTVALPFVGFSVSFLDSGAIPTGDGAIRYASQGVVGSIGLPIGPLSVGARWRFFRLSSPSTGQGWSIGPAILVVTEAVRVGLLFESALSSPIAYDGGTEEAWDPSLRLGAAVTLDPAQDVRWNATFEAADLFSSLARLLFGLEAWIGGLGARIGFDGDGPTFGLSLRFELLEIDWAYASRDDLGASHRVSLALRF